MKPKFPWLYIIELSYFIAKEKIIKKAFCGVEFTPLGILEHLRWPGPTLSFCVNTYSL